jgi:hypothetical protein
VPFNPLFYLDHPEKSSSWQLESHWKLSAKLRRLKGQFIICTNTFNGFEKAYRGMNIDKIRTLSGIKIIIS